MLCRLIKNIGILFDICHVEYEGLSNIKVYNLYEN